METETKEIKEENVWEVQEQYLSLIKEKIEWLNKKAIKLDCEPIELIIDKNPIMKAIVITNKDRIEEKKEVLVKFFKITVIGKAPKFKDWEWLLTIMSDPVTEAVTFHKSAFIDYDVTTIYNYSETPTRCEHCGINRYRKNTYIVRNIITDEIKQVGSSCIKDFTGHTNPNAIVSFYTSIDNFINKELDELEEESERSTEPRFEYLNFEQYMDAVALMTVNFGYTPTKDECPTKFEAYNLVVDVKYIDEISKHLKVKDYNYNELALKTIYWAKETAEQKKGISDFWFNIRNILIGAEKTNMIEFRNIGYIAPLVFMYLKDIGYQKEKANKKNEYFGTIGEKIEFEGIVIKQFLVDSDYGTYAICIIEDSEGRTFKWNTTKYLEEGKKYIFKTRIKDQVEYKGIKQTIISRAKFEEIIEENNNDNNS